MAAAGALPLDPSSLDAVVAAAPAPAESAVERRRRRNRDALRSYRRRMAGLYAELGAMIPALPTTSRPRRVSREEIVVAATARVKALEDAAAALEGYRVRPRPGHDVTVPSGGTMTVTVRLPAAGGALRRVVEAFERRGARVLVATMARHGGAAGDGAVVLVTVTAAAAAPEVVEMIRADIAAVIN